MPELEKKLIKIGSKKVGEYDYSRAVFDYSDLRLEKKHAWVRIRTDGKESTLTYKERIGIKSNGGRIADEGMKEIEIIVDNYKKTYEFLKSIGFVVKIEVKNKRIRYVKENVVFDIDLYPQIPPYLEIEADSLAEAQNAAHELGFNLEKSLICSAKQIFKRYGINLDDYSSITFEGIMKK